MDIYDHIESSTLEPSSSNNDPTDSSTASPTPALRADLENALRSVTASPWGSTLNSWFSSARKQGEVFVQDLTTEAKEAQEQAARGLTSLKAQVVARGRGASLGGGAEQEAKKEEGETTDAIGGASAEAAALEGGQDLLPGDIVNEATQLVASLKSTAASRLRDLQRAEDAADEALLKFGTNVRNFLRDAVTISAPPGEGTEQKEVLFETSDPGTGRKVFHSTRLDAQLHAIHTTATSFTADPAEGESWEAWKGEFDVDSKTGDIAKDLESYEELRQAMEKVVPEKVEYKVFWCRYYFLRKAVEEEEKRRKDVLKGATQEEEISWDDDEDDNQTSNTPSNPVKSNHAASASTTTLTQPASDSLKPSEPRRSHEDAKSVADSEASYDMVSGATSRAMGSPKDEIRKEGKGDESDDDWE